MKHILKILFLIFFISTSFSLHAQGPQWIVYNTGNSGLPADYVRVIAVDTNNVKWIGSDGLVQFYNNWVIYDTNNSGIHSNIVFTVECDKNNNVWTGSINSSPGGISKFDGVNWINYNSQNSSIPSGAVVNIKFDSHGNLWTTTGNGLGKFDGTNWSVYRDTNSGLPNNILTSLAIEDTIVWIGTQLYGIIKYDGTNWTQFNTNNSQLPSNRSSVDAFDLDSSNVKWFGTLGGGVARFDDVNWTIYNTNNSGLPNNYINSLFVENINRIWIGTDWGLALFENGVWNVFNTTNSPLPNNLVTNIESDKYGNLWICTPNGLAVYNENGIVSVQSITQEQPSDFNLYQNYPNPFNSTTIIQYDVKTRSNISLNVYDITGKTVAILVNDEKMPGIYEHTFKADKLSSGIYFYSLFSNSKLVKTRKFLLIK